MAGGMRQCGAPRIELPLGCSSCSCCRAVRAAPSPAAPLTASCPIDAASTIGPLAPPPIESVKVAAAQLKHPLIQPVTIDGTGGFSPDEIAVMVVVASPQLRALRDQRGVAEAQVVRQAGIPSQPQLAYAYDQPHVNSDPTLVSANSLGLSWDISALFSHPAQVASARAQAKSVDLSIAWQEWQEAQAARLRAFRILSLEERLPLARDVEAGLSDTVDVIRKAVAAGPKDAARSFPRRRKP